MILNLVLQILPIGNVAQETLHKLASDLKVTFTDVTILKPKKLLESAYDPIRNQYLSDEFLDMVKDASSGYILGITEVDLYTYHLNFVFGQAELPGRAALISLSRLHHKDPEVFYSRMLKEAVHELGHTLGLRHCDDIYCVMHFSNCLENTDVKGENFCKRCGDLWEKK